MRGSDYDAVIPSRAPTALCGDLYPILGMGKEEIYTHCMCMWNSGVGNLCTSCPGKISVKMEELLE